MFIEKTVKAGSTIFHSRRSKGTYGRRLDKNAPSNPTTERQQKRNQRRGKINLAILLNANFDNCCRLATLTYTDDNLPESYDDAKNNFAKYIRSVRRLYKKRDDDIKYISCTEYGKGTNRLHHHIVIDSVIPEKELEAKWKYGTVIINELYGEEYSDLAAYLAKKDNWAENGGHGRKWSTSRGLYRPEEEITEIPESLVRSEPHADPGYHLVDKTVVHRVSDDGYLYQSFFEVKDDGGY